ncbi:MAG: NAD(P)/FAD-dependent oxidoreductase [Chloroflexi bacterium]|jgi:predicted flavoprotein YhiN|nr:NAD(P)/FAD-dependent oxidoreductase [Chloroflexota bacterium]MBT7080569.1 NAD(P)/FAD-dependent oxidoreductase [Chloroflexota bacterium]MBT7290595.1 NAD(P)/FAD-dependent oxidoreductase [Chloroflexota bacterium]
MSAKQVIVIGAGAGGMMAAMRAAQSGADVLLLEKTERPGKKILISGNMRCNLSNAKELNDFIAMYGPNGRFLYSAFNQYFRDDLLLFLKDRGIETKTEPDGRIFPVSDDARHVVGLFERCLADNKVQIQTGAHVTDIMVNNGHVTGVKTEQKAYPATAVILATGGASYPGTGSTGDGYRMAAAVGHTITKLRPALVPLVVVETEKAKSMQGARLHNVRLSAYQCKADDINTSTTPIRDVGRRIMGKQPRLPVIESRMGDVMMTHYGIGGPVALQMTLAIVTALEQGPVSVAIDLKPTLDYKGLREQLQWGLDLYSKQNYRIILKRYLPKKLIEPFIEMTGISTDRLGCQINTRERDRLLSLLKSLRFNIKASLPLDAAMVTAGGVELKEIDPRTMASRLIKGLYFCGEVMDIDAETGGYNLQAAFSTGYVAGDNAAAFYATVY